MATHLGLDDIVLDNIDTASIVVPVPVVESTTASGHNAVVTGDADMVGDVQMTEDTDKVGVIASANLDLATNAPDVQALFNVDTAFGEKSVDLRVGGLAGVRFQQLETAQDDLPQIQHASDPNHDSRNEFKRIFASSPTLESSPEKKVKYDRHENTLPVISLAIPGLEKQPVSQSTIDLTRELRLPFLDPLLKFQGDESVAIEGPTAKDGPVKDGLPTNDVPTSTVAEKMPDGNRTVCLGYMSATAITFSYPKLRYGWKI
jgi:hypothetical protein